MKSSDRVLAERYAIAYTNLYLAGLSKEVGVQLARAATFLEDNPKFLLMLRIPSVSVQSKMAWCAQLIKDLSLPSSLYTLCFLLISSGRGFLLAQVFKEIKQEQVRRSGIMVFTITVSHAISAEKLDIIKTFLERHTGHTIVCEVTHDPSLIAGMRIRSKDLLWEHSVKKELQTALVSLIH